MKFSKIQGAGNDFIILNNMDGSIPESALPKMAKRFCTRKISVGADGLMVLVPSECADFKMLFFNSDGSVGEMCGNGARCICRFAYENSICGDIQTIETAAGIIKGHRVTDRDYCVRLNDPSLVEIDKTIIIDDNSILIDYVELGDPGVPHCIVTLSYEQEIDTERLRDLAEKIRNYNDFKKGANVNFVKIIDSAHLHAVTFERGVEDFTYACGTGCGSIVSALSLKGLINPKNVAINMPGGELTVSVSIDSNRVHDVYLTGPTNVVCSGEITDEDCFDLK